MPHDGTQSISDGDVKGMRVWHSISFLISFDRPDWGVSASPLSINFKFQMVTYTLTYLSITNIFFFFQILPRCFFISIWAQTRLFHSSRTTVSRQPSFGGRFWYFNYLLNCYITSSKSNKRRLNGERYFLVFACEKTCEGEPVFGLRRRRCSN